MDLVVARYKEDIEWVKAYDNGTFGRLYIYNKSEAPVKYSGGAAKVRTQNLPNVGVCDHTYLYHIIDNYDNLADVTVFMPGSGTLPYKKQLIDFTVDTAKWTRTTVFPVYTFDVPVDDAMYNFTLDNYNIASTENRDSGGKHEPAATRPFGKWYDQYFGDTDVKSSSFNGIFAASREHIRSRDKKFYEELIKEVSTHKFQEASHYMERAWTSMFKNIPKECLYDSPVHQHAIGVVSGGYMHLRKK
jgi:hypothetical protein